MKYSDLKGQPVVDVVTADTVGTVRELYIDSQQQRLPALRLHISGLFSGDRILLWNDIQSIGENAVTITRTDVLHEGKNVPDIQTWNQAGDILGTRIITENGADVGTVADIEVDPKSGDVTSYVLRGNLLESLQHREQLIPASWVKTIGKGLIVVKDQAASQTMQP